MGTEIVLRRMPQNGTNEKSKLVEVMAWCRQATSHHPSKFWQIYMETLNEFIIESDRRKPICNYK